MGEEADPMRDLYDSKRRDYKACSLSRIWRRDELYSSVKDSGPPASWGCQGRHSPASVVKRIRFLLLACVLTNQSKSCLLTFFLRLGNLGSRSFVFKFQAWSKPL